MEDAFSLQAYQNSMKNKIFFILKGLRISSDFKKKLILNFHALTILEMLVYLVFIRPFWDKERRFFFEGSLFLLGQMYAAERKVLYEIILEKKPRHCFEVGTYTGGGSTYFFAKAFEKLGVGEVITMEIDPYYYNKAKNYFSKKIPNVGAHVDFILGGEAKEFDEVIKKYGGVDCVFLDGAEDGGQTLAQYNYFVPHFHKGSILIVHDWNTEKTRMLKPVLIQDARWKLVKEINPPVSVGLVIFVMT